MYDTNIDLSTLPDWLECADAKAWARTDQASESIPSFGSSARSKFQQAIADDEAEIMRLEDSICGIILQVREIQGRIERNRAILAPIRLLPNEILSAIFLDWLDLRDGPDPAKRGYFRPPSTIMKVCRRWTACVISTPEIWTHAQYRIDASDIACLGQLGLFRSYFDRSGSRSLKVFFNTDDEDDTGHIWCELVVPALCRVESLRIWGTYRDIRDVGPIIPDDGLDRMFVNSLTLCTRLSELVLSAMEFLDSVHQPAIVLPTVQTIEYYLCTGNPPIQCPRLVTCRIVHCKLEGIFTSTLSTTSRLLKNVLLRSSSMDCGIEHGHLWPTFSGLKYLEIDHHDGLFPDCFSDAPNINRLHVHLKDSIFSHAIEIILLSSYSSLTSLTLNMTYNMVELPPADVQNIHKWMAQAHKIVEFGLIFEQFPEEFYDCPDYHMNMYMDPLLTTKRDPPCFPYLKHVTIGNAVRLMPELYQLLADRATDAERAEAGLSTFRMSPGIVQRPCLLTLVNSNTLPDMDSVGLNEFLDMCKAL